MTSPIKRIQSTSHPKSHARTLRLTQNYAQHFQLHVAAAVGEIAKIFLVIASCGAQRIVSGHEPGWPSFSTESGKVRLRPDLLIFQSAAAASLLIFGGRQPDGRSDGDGPPASLTSAAAFTLRGNRIDQQHLRTKATLPKPMRLAVAATTQYN